MEGTLAAALLAVLGTYLLIVLFLYVLLVIAYWKIFTKAGQPGWKSIIPIYNQYVLYRISWKNPYMFWVSLACSFAGMLLATSDGWISIVGMAASFVSMIITILLQIKLSKAYGHGIGFAIGLLLLGNIFTLILGFGSSQYQGPQD